MLKIFQGIIFLYVKFVTGILFYFLYQFIQLDMKSFIYTFVILYVIERFFSCLIEIKALNTNKVESLIIIILNPIQLEEVYFMINYKRHTKYIKDGIQGQALIISIFHIPLYVIAIIWTMKYQFVLQNAILLTFIIVILFSGPYFLAVEFFIKSNLYQLYSTYDSYQLNLRFSLMYILSLIHFLTFFWTVSLIWRYYNFGYYFLAINTLLLAIFFYQIRKRLSNIFRYRSCEKAFFYFITTIKQIFHLSLEIRFLDIFDQIIDVNQYGYKLFNQMIIYEFGIKLYLLITYSLLYFSNIFNDDQLNKYYTTIFIMVLLSTLILGYQILTNIIWRQIMRLEILEFDNNEEFTKVISQIDKLQDKKIKLIRVFDQQDNFQNVEIVVEILLFQFDKSQIICQNANRRKLSHNEEGLLAGFSQQITYKEIIKVIDNRKVMPSIGRVYFYLQNFDCIFDLHKKFIENNMGVLLATNYDQHNNEFTLFKHNKNLEIKTYCAQLLLFERYMQSEMLNNPKEIYYDLYDQIND